MDSVKLAAVSLLAALSLTACKSAPPAAPKPKAVPKPVYPDISHLTDEQLARANQSDGIGLGLRIAGGVFTAGQNIPLHLVLEDFSATSEIASGLCGGVRVAYEDTSSEEHAGGSADLDANPHCFAGTPYPDSVALTKGTPKIFDVSLQRNAHIDLPPGDYLIGIEWQAYQIGPPTVGPRSAFANVHSNQVHIVVKP